MGSTTTPEPIPWPILTATWSEGHHPGVPPEALSQISSPERIGSKLLVLALHWLKEDRLIRLKHEAEGDPAFKKRGARIESSVPSDSEVFYRKCVFKKSYHMALTRFIYFLRHRSDILFRFFFFYRYDYSNSA